MKGTPMAGDRSQNSGCLFALFSIFFGGKGRNGGDELPYRVRADFLSPAELSFYHVLNQVVKERAVICPKVRLGDIFFAATGVQKLAFTNRISAKHIDLLLCEPKTLRPLAGVELDDSSHNRRDRIDRDEFVNEVFAAAGLPIIHIKARREYNPSDVASQVLPHLETQPATSAPSVSSTTSAADPDSVPLCPKCGVPMLLRTKKNGPNKGSQFYGCPNFPRCREVKAI